MFYKSIVLLLLIGTSIGVPVTERPKDFSEHQVIRILPNLSQQLKQLREIKKDFKNVNFWNEPLPDFTPVLTLVGPKDRGFLSALSSSHINYEIVSNNFQKVIDSERQENERNSGYYSGFDYETKYHNYSDIKTELNSITTQNPKAIYKSVGKSYEGRDIPAIVITNSGTEAKKTIFFECGIHAREWISTAFCLNMINQLLTNTEYNKYLDKYEFIIVPALNVDGYAYTWEVDRSWRKTRSPNHGSNCIGTDPNRNWDDAWGKEGASDDPCSEAYYGPKPFSEVEIKQWTDLIQTRKGKIAAYFAFHSFSQLFMYPYGYTHTLPPNAKQLDLMAKAGVSAIKATHGSVFKEGNIADTIYLASGSSIDWVYEKCDANATFALELRPDPSSPYGFVLPPSQIKPACEETWAGVKAVIDLL